MNFFEAFWLHVIQSMCAIAVQTVEASVLKDTCLSVVTGWPEVSYREKHLKRVLTQLATMTLEFEIRSYVFCQGECPHWITEEYSGFNFNSVRNTVNRSDYVGFIISENYKHMFRSIFEEAHCVYCIILEDDLLLSPDALQLFVVGIDSMSRDDSIFCVSLYNDNSLPWLSSDGEMIRRIQHFSGLGWALSANNYNRWMRDTGWDGSKVWDAQLQSFMAQKKLSCLQPEVSRVVHAESLQFQFGEDTNDVVPMDKYSCHVYSHGANSFSSTPINYLLEQNYDQFIEQFVCSAIQVDNLLDAAWFASRDKILSTETKENEAHFIGLYWIAKGRPTDLHDLFRRLGITGLGLGGVFRGVYKDSIFMRPFGVLVLILSPQSPFVGFVVDHGSNFNSNCGHTSIATETKLYSEQLVCDSFEITQPGFKFPNIPENLVSIMYHILQNYHVGLTTGNPESCQDYCSSRQMACIRNGFWLLHFSCEILLATVPQCTSCETVSYSTGFDNFRSFPAMNIKDNGCYLGESNYYNCLTSLTDANLRRICTCSAQL